MFGFEGSADGSVSVHGGDTEQERTEVRPEHLEELDGAAQQVPAQEQGRGQGPGDLREQRQQRCQQVSHGEVHQEHVHPGNLAGGNFETLQTIKMNEEFAVVVFVRYTLYLYLKQIHFYFRSVFEKEKHA